MAKPKFIELPNGLEIPILYEDRAVMAIDKPAGWMLAPDDWDRTARNLQLALISSINGGDFWAQSRQLKFLRFVHRLDADTSGLLLLAKSPGALKAYSELFEEREVKKWYLAVVQGVPKQNEWRCNEPLALQLNASKRIEVDTRSGRDAETLFRILQAGKDRALIEAQPLTGRTHQIRVHLASSGHPVLEDSLYGIETSSKKTLALRAVALHYTDPFTKRLMRLEAPAQEFVREWGFNPEQLAVSYRSPQKPK